MASTLTCSSLNLNPSQAPTPCKYGSSVQSRLHPVAMLKKVPQQIGSMKNVSMLPSSPQSVQIMLQKSVVPLAASIAVILLSATPVSAGLLSGLSGIESVPGPELPQIDFLNRWNEENQKKYAENDARFKETPLLKKLLEKSKLNKEKNQQALMDKYCLRGAEWGVGDCSAAGMTPEDRDKFISMLKQKVGVNE